MTARLRFVDTQILISAIQGAGNAEVRDTSISSVVAAEFLGTQGKDPTSANYYVPLVRQGLQLTRALSRFPRRDHPFGKRSTDSVLMDFGGQYPAVVHFGNLAIADVVNSAITPIFDDAIELLPKERKKAARRKFDFLLDNRITCVPLSANTIQVAQDLLVSFIEKNALKENFRNSWNDLLIAATTLEARGTLITEDDLLARHVADYVHASAVAVPGGLEIDFSEEHGESNPRRRESKGFINQGWRVRFSQNRR